MSLHGTDIINHFDLPKEIKSIEGTFKYRFFVADEQVNEENSNLKESEPDSRYNLITWKGEGTLRNIQWGEETLVHRENLFFPGDLNSGFCILTTDEIEVSQRQDIKVSDASVGSKLDYLLTSVASNKFTEDLEENLSSSKKTTIPVLDPTTGRPIKSTTSIDGKGQPSDIMIRNVNLHKVISYSNFSPLNRNVFSDIEESAMVISKSSKSKLNKIEGKRVLTTLSYAMTELSNPASTSTAKLISLFRGNNENSILKNWELIGYCVSKYRKNGDKQTYMYSRIVKSRQFRDPYVAYGQSYRYDIRPIYGKYQSDSSSELIILASDESAFIDIECVELRAPNPPKNIKFEYILNNQIRMNWSRPESYVVDENKAWETNDIKGYQIFLRTSLLEPYSLYRYFTFNNTYPRSATIYSKELITDEFIISSEYNFPADVDLKEIPKFYEFLEYILEIRPNTNYYVAMCSIDAHGNSSTYSAQYKIRRNNVTGEVDIQLVCPSGAPKQYPNLLVPGKLVNPSFKSSGYQHLDIYFAPDTQLSVPNIGEPAVNLQLFELETQIEKNITISIKERPKTAN